MKARQVLSAVQATQGAGESEGYWRQDHRISDGCGDCCVVSVFARMVMNEKLLFLRAEF